MVPSILAITLRTSHRARLASLGFLAAVGVLLHAALPAPHTSWLDSLVVSTTLQRLGPSYLWTLHAEWGDQIVPVVILASLAVAERWFFPERSQDAERESRERLLVAWLVAGLVLAAVMPRVSIEHGLLFILPAFLLAPNGWRVMRALPCARSDPALAAFTVTAHLALLYLVSFPVATTVDALLVAAIKS